MVNTASANALTMELESGLTGILYRVTAEPLSEYYDIYRVFVGFDNVSYLRIDFSPPERGIEPYYRLAEAPLQGAHEAVVREQIAVIAKNLVEVITRYYNPDKKLQVPKPTYEATDGLPSAWLTAHFAEGPEEGSKLPPEYSKCLRAGVLLELGKHIAGLAFH